VLEIVKQTNDTFGYSPARKKRRDPAKLSDDLLDRYDLVVDELGNCYRYDGQQWCEASKHQLQSYALSVDTRDHTNSRRRNETIAQALSRRQIGTIDWNQLGAAEVPLDDCVVDVVTKCARPHRREDWLNRLVPHQLDDNKDPPARWLQCIEEWFEGDPEIDEKRLALQEFMGYVMLPHARFKKALLLYGAPDCGKSVVVALLRLLVGHSSCCAISVEAMDDPRKLAPIKGRALNILGELPARALIEDGGFKSLISTGDPVQIDEKFKCAELIIPTAKHVFACNSLPRIDDRTTATYNRILVIRFPNTLPEERWDRNLIDKLTAELPQILRWALMGARRLVECAGVFQTVNESRTLLDELKLENNPVDQFMRECTERSDGEFVTVAELRKSYKGWSGDGRMSPVGFGRLLSSAGFRSVAVNGVRRIHNRFWRRRSIDEACDNTMQDHLI